MIKLTPKPNYKYLRISDNTVCDGEVYLGIYDNPENYKLITDEEATAIKKKQLEEETKAELEAMKAEEEEMKKAKEEARKAKETKKQAKPQSMLRQINGGKKSW